MTKAEQLRAEAIKYLSRADEVESRGRKALAAAHREKAEKLEAEADALEA